jgi:peptidoglycan/LPS O-acetylase OafA/YrhL
MSLTPSAGAPTPTASFYRPELDALRFFAFLAVFAFHTVGLYRPETFAMHHVPAWIAETVIDVARGGAFGVDLFFVLSAYLITELMLREKQKTGALDVKAFYARRILRIWPLYYFFVPLAFAVPFLNPDHEFSIHYLIPFLLLAGNWSLTLFGWHLGRVVIPLWSVSIEEQFYLVWPPIVARLSRNQITTAAVGMLLVANAVRFWEVARHVDPQHLWPNTFAHLDSIAVGVLLSVLMNGRMPDIRNIYRMAMAASGVTCFAVVAHFVAPDLTAPITSLTVLLCYVAIVVACLAILMAFMGVNLQSRWLVYLGKISYGLYVYHMACIFIVRRVPALNHAFSEPISLALTIAVAAVSYQILEKPFLSLKPRFTHVASRPA